MTTTTIPSSALIDGLSGGVSGVITELLFYSIDSFKIQLQAGEKIQIGRLFRGAFPIACCGSFPSFGVFFAVFHECKRCICGDTYTPHGILLSSLIAAIPSSIIAVPADVLKKRIILGGSERNLRETAMQIIRNHGVKGLFLGWEANLLRDVPFAGLKLSLYEGISQLYLQYYKVDSNITSLTPIESAGVGLLCGPITALITSPLDCVNTRVKSGELASFNFLTAHSEIVKRSGIQGLFRGLLPRTVIISFGSTVFWFWYSRIQTFLGEVDSHDDLKR